MIDRNHYFTRKLSIGKNSKKIYNQFYGNVNLKQLSPFLLNASSLLSSDKIVVVLRHCVSLNTLKRHIY